MKTQLPYLVLFYLFQLTFINIINAQSVNYFDFSPNMIIQCSGNPGCSSTYDIDFNDDSIPDFSFYVESYWGVAFVKLTSLNGSEFIYSGNYVDTLNYGDQISGSQEWISGDLKFFKCNWYSGTFEGTWQNVRNKFTGIRLQVNGEWYYGWLRINSFDTYLIIKDYGISTSPDSAILAGQALPPKARNLYVSDISNYKDGRDLKVKADIEFNEFIVDEYRIICIKHDSLQSFDLNKALSLDSLKYITVLPTGNKIITTFDSISMDSDGDTIREFVPYNIVILSITKNIPGTSGHCLSSYSNTITLKSYTGPVTNIIVHRYYNHDLTYNFNITFKIPGNETGITEYRVYFVKTSDESTFNIDTALSVPQEYYISLIPNGQNHSLSLYSPDVTDYKGDTIELTKYRVYIVSLDDGIICNTPTMRKSGIFNLSKATPKVNEIFLYDNGNNSNAGDLTIVFDSVNQSNINAYRVILVKESEVPDFNLQKANALEPGCMFDILPSNSNINCSLSPDMLDSNGDIIHSDSLYRAFVLTLCDTFNTTTNTLSNASNLVALATPNHFKAGQKWGNGVYYYDIIPDTSLLPIKETLKYYFDLNNDGTDDFYIKSKHCSSPSFIEVSSACVPLNGNQVNVIPSQINCLDIVDSAFMIDENLCWRSSQATFYYSFESIMPGNSYSCGIWNGKGFRYLGLRMFTNTDTIYGWIQLKTISCSVTINDFASRNESTLDIENNHSFTFSVFPNPADRLLNIVIPNNFSEKVNYKFFNTNGTILKSGTFDTSQNNVFTLDVSMFNQGIYLLQLIANNTVLSKKVIIH